MEQSYDFAYEKAKEANCAEDIETLEKIGRPVEGCYREISDGMGREIDYGQYKYV